MRLSPKWAVLAVLFATIPCTVGKGPDKVPTVGVLNGTYYGVHSRHYDQDFFLGVPYAQQPVGNLRLQVPHSLNTSWTEPRNATEYSPS
jgi:triacylglycerol lipase